MRFSPSRSIAQGLSEAMWIPCMEAITPNSAKRGMSSRSKCWACSIRKRWSLLGSLWALIAFSNWLRTSWFDYSICSVVDIMFLIRSGFGFVRLWFGIIKFWWCSCICFMRREVVFVFERRPWFLVFFPENSQPSSSKCQLWFLFLTIYFCTFFCRLKTSLRHFKRSQTWSFQQSSQNLLDLLNQNILGKTYQYLCYTLKSRFSSDE